LSGTAAIVYELLKAQPPHKAMLGPAIVDALEARHRIVIDDSTLRKNIFPKLEPWGLQHKKKVGYWIEDSA
jgi:hypothetical protein